MELLSKEEANQGMEQFKTKGSCSHNKITLAVNQPFQKINHRQRLWQFYQTTFM